MSRKVAIVVDVAWRKDFAYHAIDFSRFILSQEVYKQSSKVTNKNEFTGYWRKFEEQGYEAVKGFGTTKAAGMLTQIP